MTEQCAIGVVANKKIARACKHRYFGHQCFPINCTRGTNLATRELIKHCKDVPVIIAFELPE